MTGGFEDTDEKINKIFENDPKAEIGVRKE
jgi:hypothetical protein